MNVYLEQLADRLQEAEIIAVLNEDFALQDIIEIGDALLAAPVLALEVDLKMSCGLEAIAELRQRAGELMLIGAAGVRTIADFNKAVAAEAQFVVSPNSDTALLAHANRQNLPYLPTASGETQVKQVSEQGCRFLKLERVTPAQLKSFKVGLNGVTLFPAGGVTFGNLGRYVEAGAGAVVTGDIIRGPMPSMAGIITRARAWRRTWQQVHTAVK